MKIGNNAQENYLVFDRSTNQPTDQPTDHSIKQPATQYYKPTDRPISQLIKQPTIHSPTNQLLNQSTN